eukprot:234945_1
MLSSVLVLSYAITTVFALGPHDTVSFDLTHFKSDNQLDFDLLGQHYKVQLRRNDNHLPSLFKTSGDIDPLASASLSDDNCYYYGHVLEPHQPDGSYLSLSLCANRGIRGTITLPNTNEQLFILPSAIVTDPQYDREVGIYHLTDPHMVYKDHSESFLPRAQSHGSKGGSRGLLRSSWKNKVELYVLADAAWTQVFKKHHGSRWYDELVSYTKELINAASAEYEWWDWKDLGTIELAMVELEIMGDFTGRYSSMQPRFRKPEDSGEPDCRNKDWKWNNYECLLKSQTEWWYNNGEPLKDFGKYHLGKHGDAFLVLTGFDAHLIAGLAAVQSMCTDTASGMVSCAGCYQHGVYHGHKFRVKAVAHEIGHVFSAHHTTKVGIMGAGKGSGGYDFYHNGWSDPAVNEIEAYFSKARGLSCLRNGVDSFKVTNNAGNTGSTSGGSSSGTGCIEIKSVSSSYNGEYKKGSNGIYSSGKYQFLFKGNGNWALNYRVSAVDYDYVCYKSNIMDCDRSWFVYGTKRSGGRTVQCGSFTADEDLSCIQNNDAVCVENYNDTIADEWTFVPRRHECYTEQVVYEYEQYLLFYNEDYEYNDDEEMRGRWIISEHEIRVIDALATCDEEDLLQCFEGKWKVSVAMNDTLEWITHATMGVSNGYCASYEGARGAVGEEKKKEGTTSSQWVTVVCVVLLLVVILIAVGCFIYRSRRAKKAQFTLDVVEEESEEEDEVEVETNLTQTTR